MAIDPSVDPYASDPSTPQPPTGPPAPLSPEEEAAALAYFTKYRSEHGIPANYANVEAAMNDYRGARQQGQTHDQALQSVPDVLAWSRYVGPGSPGPAPTGGGSGGGAPVPYDTGSGGIPAPGMPNDPNAPGGGTPGGLVPPDGTYPGTAPPLPGGGGGGIPGYPGYTPPAPYEFTPFKGPTAADMLSDPSYQFRFDQGLNAVRADKAARGVLNGGGTARALLNYGQDAASQEYKNVWDRSINTYDTNEAGRYKTYLTNTQGQVDTPYANARQSALDKQNTGQFDYNSAYNQWIQQYNQWRNARNDAFDQKWKVAAG